MPGAVRKALEERKAELRQSGLAFESERFVPTADDWYPCFYHSYKNEDGKWVTVELDRDRQLVHGSPMVLGRIYVRAPVNIAGLRGIALLWFVRISFWGNDDTGIEKDFYFHDEKDAREQYFRLVSYLNNIAIVCRDDLLKYSGFVWV